MKNSPSNIFYILLLLERCHKNCEAVLAATGMNGLRVFRVLLDQSSFHYEADSCFSVKP